MKTTFKSGKTITGSDFVEEFKDGIRYRYYGTDIDGIDFVEEFKDGRYGKCKSIYKKEDIPILQRMMDDYFAYTKTDKYRRMVEADESDWGRCYGRPRYGKIIELLKTGVSVEGYSSGLVLVDGKFIVSLNKNKWRVKGKGKWYYHPHDLKKWKMG